MTRTDEEWNHTFCGLLLWYNTKYSAVLSAAKQYLEAVDRGQEWRGNLLADMRQAVSEAREVPPDDAVEVGHEWRDIVLRKIAEDAKHG